MAMKLFSRKKSTKAAAKDKTGGMDLIRALLQNPPLIALLIADLAKFMFNFVLMGVAAYYFSYIAGNSGMLPTYILVTNIFCVVEELQQDTEQQIQYQKYYYRCYGYPGCTADRIFCVL